MNKSNNLATLVLALSLFLYPTFAHAYVDPGSGSIIVTTILGFLAAIAYTFRKYFYKLRKFLKMEKTKKEENRSLDD